MVERHHGWLSVVEKNEALSSLSLYIPADHKNYALDEIRPSLEHSVILENIIEDSGGNKRVNNEITQQPTVLIVDDEIDARSLLREALEPYYQIIEAENGEMGFQMLLTYPVDLAICDLAMPLMDGISFLKKVRGSIELNDIPVIMLIEKEAEIDKLLCLENNADDFIEKPLVADLFVWRVKNLLANRQNLKAKYSRKIEVIQQDNLSVSSPDDKFIHDILDLIETNLTDPNLNVEQLAEKMCMSRATLYRKMEELFSESPSLFIRKFRLQKAANLLSSGKFYVSQVSYMVGIKNPKHFTQSFQREYGITPTEYIRQKKEEPAAVAEE